MATNDVRKACMKKMSGQKIYPHRGKMTLRQVVAETGVGLATLSRFFNGRQVQSDTLDKLSEWVSK